MAFFIQNLPSNSSEREEFCATFCRRRTLWRLTDCF